MIRKTRRDGLGQTPGTEIDRSRLGAGVHIEPRTRTARLERGGEHLVIVGDTRLTDEEMFALIDAGRGYSLDARIRAS